jgi:hypothetical protein
MITIYPLRLTALLVCFLYLQACAPILPKETANPLFTVASIDEGAVAVSLTTNSAQLSYLNAIVVEPVLPENNTVKSTNAKPAQYYLRSVKAINRDTHLFAGNLPVGEYNILSITGRNLSSQVGMGMTFTLEIPDLETLGSFEVKPNSLADLGRLIVSAINLKGGVGYKVKRDTRCAKLSWRKDWRCKSSIR